MDPNSQNSEWSALAAIRRVFHQKFLLVRRGLYLAVKAAYTAEQLVRERIQARNEVCTHYSTLFNRIRTEKLTPSLSKALDDAKFTLDEMEKFLNAYVNQLKEARNKHNFCSIEFWRWKAHCSMGGCLESHQNGEEKPEFPEKSKRT
jgi:hypothetical protein